MDAERITKGLADAIPLGPHPNPHAEWISVRLDFVQAAIDHIEWLEKGNAEWRAEALSNVKHAKAARATARIAIDHLQAVLVSPGDPRYVAAFESASHWLISIGCEP
jgi:hypothetical protein